MNSNINNNKKNKKTVLDYKVIKFNTFVVKIQLLNQVNSDHDIDIDIDCF